MTRLKEDVERGLVADIFKEESDSDDNSDQNNTHLTFDQVCHKMEGSIAAEKLINQMNVQGNQMAEARNSGQDNEVKKPKVEVVS